MEFEEPLRKAGLTGNESTVFIQLLRYGEQSANGAAKKIGMDRTLTYTVLNNLIEKGLVSYITKSGKKFFKALDPSNLLNPIKEKEVFIRDLIPKLKAMEKKESVDVEVNIYEGKEAIRNIYNLFKKYKEILSFGATGRAYDLLYESPTLTKEIVRRGVKGKIITSRKNKNHPMTKIKTIDVRYVSYESEITTTIFGNYVMNHIAKEKPVVVLIKNKEMADTYRKHFELLWNAAKK